MDPDVSADGVFTDQAPPDSRQSNKLYRTMIDYTVQLFPQARGDSGNGPVLRS